MYLEFGIILFTLSAIIRDFLISNIFTDIAALPFAYPISSVSLRIIKEAGKSWSVTLRPPPTLKNSIPVGFFISICPVLGLNSNLGIF